MKKIVKRIASWGMIGALAVGLTACGGSTSGNSVKANSGGSDEETQTTGSTTLDDIIEKGTITVGISLNGAPIGFTDDNGKPQGYDVDWAQQLADTLGVELEIVNVDADTRIPTLTSGRVDVLFANITGNMERAKTIDFSIPYLRCGIKMLTAKGSQYKEVEDLNDSSVTVSVNRGSTGEALAQEYAPNANIVYVDNFTDSVLQIQQGKADATFEDNTVVDYAAAQNSDTLEAQERTYTSDPICIGCRKGDIEFVRYLDMFVSWQITQGWQAETYEKWWGTEPAELDALW